MQQAQTLKFIEVPGHGWLEVPKNLIKELGIEDKITTYSYMANNMAYLEEDLDMGIFLQSAEKQGHTLSIKRVYEEETPIRNMPRYHPHC